MSNTNDHLVLVCGESSTGKSVSLSNLTNALYLNCEAGKRLPFKPKDFKEVVITDPYQVYEAFEWVEAHDEYQYVVIDGLNYLMDMYESIHVLNSSNTMQGWSNYAQYFKNLMQKYVASSSKAVIFTAHTKSVLNEKAMSMEVKVPIKGSLANQGVESYFSCIVSTKKATLDDLAKYDNELLTYTDREKDLGFKYVFQTQITKDTLNERMRSPMGLFNDAETFINNDVSLVINRLNEYYS